MSVVWLLHVWGLCFPVWLCVALVTWEAVLSLLLLLLLLIVLLLVCELCCFALLLCVFLVQLILSLDLRRGWVVGFLKAVGAGGRPNRTFRASGFTALVAPGGGGRA